MCSLWIYCLTIAVQHVFLKLNGFKQQTFIFHDFLGQEFRQGAIGRIFLCSVMFKISGKINALSLTFSDQLCLSTVGQWEHPCGLRFITTWQLGPPPPVFQETAKWKAQCLLWPSLERYTALLLQPHPDPRGEDMDSTYQWKECQRS